MWVLGLNLTLTSLEKGDFAGDIPISVKTAVFID
jgi:hypothetical protein